MKMHEPQDYDQLLKKYKNMKRTNIILVTYVVLSLIIMLYNHFVS
jgi:hypothetical protein